MGLISKEIQGFTTEQINQLDKNGSLEIVIAKYRNLSIEDVEIARY
jgi:isoleucyl-tRNA synthetase